ncbi:hypothetical protein [Limimaricola litoreus]|uniref:Porin n=1 Tax=Limimaricola litoreus TaxID=2955316 RepID=A0A9X2FZK2_9RHOB|nr:hypothetical protein [Limimaricola litoreus]MCP1170013.1 hypothetical protein [Limimaricola litoreus]
MIRLIGHALLAFVLSAGLARADGEYLQFDLGPTDSTAVGSFERDGISTGAVWSRYTDGGSLGFSTSLSRQLSLGGRPVTLRYGPSLRYDGDVRLGAKIVAENYTSTDWGGVFVIGEINSIDWSYFSMIEASRNPAGQSLALVATGDDTGYAEQSLVVAKTISGSDWRIRAGYRLQAREVFVGAALNTF